MEEIKQDQIYLGMCQILCSCIKLYRKVRSVLLLQANFTCVALGVTYIYRSLKVYAPAAKPEQCNNDNNNSAT